MVISRPLLLVGGSSPHISIGTKNREGSESSFFDSAIVPYKHTTKIIEKGVKVPLLNWSFNSTRAYMPMAPG